MSDILKNKSTEFLDRLQNDLREAEERYKGVSSDMEEYVFVRSFITKEKEFGGDKVDRKMIMNFGKQVYTKAKVKANAKLFIRVQGDLFIEMSYDRALNFIERRLEFLNRIADDYLKDIAQIRAHITMLHAVLDPSKLQ